MADRRIGNIILPFLFLFLSLHSCNGNKVYIISDPQLESLEGKFINQRISAFFRGTASRYIVLHNSTELPAYLAELSNGNEKPLKLILSPFYWSLQHELDKNAWLQYVWLNVDPQKNERTIYTSWDNLHQIEKLDLYIPEGKILVLYGNESLSQERLNGLRKLFSTHAEVQWKSISEESLPNLEENIDLSLYKGFFLAAGSLNVPLYSVLSKWNTPIGGELPYINNDSDLLYLQVQDNWPEMVDQALKSFKDKVPGYPVTVFPLWKGNETSQRP